ncbi:hypothetical protein [Hydrogenophaga sp.]|uniref:hypothetical protein n=1 Tax=Hydrogenophaga sp. TaxID=1904254 RepID=UPI002ABC7E63|nr:hypothetical protein [Hydrogenophaga sp.]MDZ4397981.1 hypothetical protein [Hydrogenophaga sp.]
MTLATKSQALEAVVLMQTALDEALALQERLRQAEAAGRTLEVDLLQAQAATMTARLQDLSAEIDRTREEFMRDIQEVATATLAVMTRVAEMEGAPHGHNS